MWKSIVKRQYPNPLDYQRFMGNFSSVVGFSTCIVIFLGVQAIRILGWRIGALATPMVMACLAIPYFSSILIGLDSPQQLRIAVIFGTLNSLLSKTTKYALFDPTWVKYYGAFPLMHLFAHIVDLLLLNFGVNQQHSNGIHTSGWWIEGKGQSCNRGSRVKDWKEWRVFGSAISSPCLRQHNQCCSCIGGAILLGIGMVGVFCT